MTSSVLPSAEEILRLLPENCSIDSLKNEQLLPLRIREGVLQVALASPKGMRAAQIFGASLGYPVEAEYVEEQQIAERIRDLYNVKGGLRDESVTDVEGIDDLNSLAREDVLSDSVDAPVIRLMNSLLLEAIRERATDIHVEPYEDEVVVRFRVDGVLHDRIRLPRGHQAPLTSRIKVMARMDIAHRFAPQDGRIGITLGGRAVDIRVGSVPTQHGERIALRILDKTRGLLSLEDLGMDPEERAVTERIIASPHGMILLTGPTGSGKSTTLYAMLQAIARPEVNIITVEDPVEYDVPGIAQIQVNEKAGVSFASALRAILRQDPDVVMVGEMRDYETAHIGVQASLTGHLVLSTLHTNDSISAVTRLVDMEIEPYLVGGCLVAAIAQRLVRRNCPLCTEECEVPLYLKKRGVRKAFRGRGCEACRNTGYSGRVGLYEQFVVNETLREAIARRAPLGELRKLAEAEGFVSLFDRGIRKVEQGMTSPEELSRVAGEA
ncbi:MAG TPA: GspE/PulE family protein [Synergistaceae bacterium]|nr:GspE/PulE family protein [Synergistaceae bacterium]HPQ38373.1 GspE/PulE family protein [Synergistaceae bacterium]